MNHLESWKNLQNHAALNFKGSNPALHLRNLILDEARSNSMKVEFDGIVLDYSRSRATRETVSLWFDLARETKIAEKIKAMVSGEICNVTEQRQVLHAALRCSRDSKRFSSEIVKQVSQRIFLRSRSNKLVQVWAVLDRAFAFAESVRSGKHTGATGKPIRNVVSIGIGGSYLGPEFVHEAMKFHPNCYAQSRGRTLRFLANVDPVDVARALDGLDPAETMIVVVSKTFTTAETMLNARTAREWLLRGISAAEPANVVSCHMVAVSAAPDKAKAFGINENNVFGFWDWVGGRYSVCSSVGVVPLALQYGREITEQFLTGAREMDEHFFTAPLPQNLPVILGLVSVWNHTFLGYTTRAILPYSQALLRFPAHIQQVSMESNGKRVSNDGTRLEFEAGEIIFGEPGTNGQHSFYQLIHQGRVIPCDFIGVCKSQHPIMNSGDLVSNHDELMSNFFAQPDALARGKTEDDLKNEKVPPELIAHKTFPGDRPSVSILLPELDARRIGQLLSLYENQVAVQGFVWGINSFDQWGVELGKVLATQVRNEIAEARKTNRQSIKADFCPSTKALLERYLQVNHQ